MFASNPREQTLSHPVISIVKRNDDTLAKVNVPCTCGKSRARTESMQGEVLQTMVPQHYYESTSELPCAVSVAGDFDRHRAAMRG
ncbi:hypothetical protein CNECB9_2510006 [Cupriavidus necator]|uniref:Uncharacterized protein n=1 Tax=Cupriavidus necator TaxID=106590 RepID=A0A1K0IS58_CUPNE|nr:hypothetical protein CNECB9_2510006 [Cupriavidus necator]